jgi:hypothetical protein
VAAGRDECARDAVARTLLEVPGLEAMISWAAARSACSFPLAVGTVADKERLMPGKPSGDGAGWGEGAAENP